MADFSIDQNRLPGVKEVCRDFAVLEDGCLAYSLQEQEIESHLASNIHKSRLIRSDIQVARRLQEEEDLQVQARGQRWQRDIDQSDTEVAKGIQDRLVRQAEQQRRQEKMDEAIARKLQEKEMKEGKKKKKQQEVFVEPHCEGRGDWNVQGNYSMKEVTQDINRLALQDQELRDMEVARKLYKEEQKASQADTRAAQVAQDEEIARLLMDEERRRCMSSREKSRPDVNSRASSEQVVRARSHEDSQRSIKEKPARPPPPTRNRENVDPCPTRLPTRTEPTSRGPNCRR
ncbi:coiled-coil domain-containing protein 50-like isoform X1 [Megalops cyprinoides]|uniref:coiled-coil domain-containing protein 50-like isoform X1 n=1 Tax=Megalops cyprinoides TaxID=118141 RepID=UPI001863A009|nr:coiled-coil domain-containing protein 50-like isoform X1 [Megalops cyprinoides]